MLCEPGNLPFFKSEGECRNVFQFLASQVQSFPEKILPLGIGAFQSDGESVFKNRRAVEGYSLADGDSQISERQNPVLQNQALPVQETSPNFSQPTSSKSWQKDWSDRENATFESTIFHEIRPTNVNTQPVILQEIRSQSTMIRDLVGEAEMEDALKMLLNLSKNVSATITAVTLEEDAVLASNKYYLCMKLYRKGECSFADLQTNTARVTSTILDLLKNIERKTGLMFTCAIA